MRGAISNASSLRDSKLALHRVSGVQPLVQGTDLAAGQRAQGDREVVQRPGYANEGAIDHTTSE